jgi:hypothetical protein
VIAQHLPVVARIDDEGLLGLASSLKRGKEVTHVVVQRRHQSVVGAPGAAKCRIIEIKSVEVLAELAQHPVVVRRRVIRGKVHLLGRVAVVVGLLDFQGEVRDERVHREQPRFVVITTILEPIDRAPEAVLITDIVGVVGVVPSLAVRDGPGPLDSGPAVRTDPRGVTIEAEGVERLHMLCQALIVEPVVDARFEVEFANGRVVDLIIGEVVSPRRWRAVVGGCVVPGPDFVDVPPGGETRSRGDT